MAAASVGIVQTPGGVTMYYDVGQGQGWQRNIVMTGAASAGRHSPVVRRLARPFEGRCAGHRRHQFQSQDRCSGRAPESASRRALAAHRSQHDEYAVTVDDPTVWTRPWTPARVHQQSEEQNRIYYEPRCVEGNYGHPALMLGARVEELAYAEGRGPHPAPRTTPRISWALKTIRSNKDCET
jgi:hypothetical protein